MLHETLWVPDKGRALTLRNECHRILDKASKRIDGKQFDITVEWAIKVIRFAAERLHIPIYRDAEIERLCLTRQDFELAQIERDGAPGL